MLVFKKMFLSAMMLSLVLLMSACASVKPWQKEYLAKPQMSLESSTPLAEQFKQEVYTSRAASKGGYSFGGGGCGCD
ncbi:DUF4266 domain-containing protein [Thiotrichales bacterium 19X7-9]|nr:DUF4266 domain-containing protein [Thiotrichales bacterium 19X7-9]TNF69738.1 MAG: DUF4266 domain-containing protein [Gammaproteobacteria bacterium]UTW42436.1 DUF4266 domain-containing protein [bacterium SCSIO 12844]